ncbi:3-methyl-2-oxobutanoate hydroxymethyltransferase [Brevibacterium ihuae]|uniref:3-methyl-2-oxobutanoate hydroxymethyltransferase n=1 Tax=Brevibacterium ihuae TaxID=1631743 RepID=UPI000C75FD54|nr:3-methyl-2-oxobutanoate hydroxymethyltransferase [Brevibacterium ihuae]
MSYHRDSQPSEKRRAPVRTLHLAQWKAEGRRWSMLTAYDYSTAAAFDDAEIPVLLVGDSAANVVYGESTTIPATLDQMIALATGVVRGAPNTLVVVDLPFGSYEVSPSQAVESAIRVMKESGAHAVKLEGGAERAAAIRAVVDAGIPVMAHVGFTPQSVNALGGYRVQGRDEAAATTLREDARAVEEAGAFAVVLEMVPANVAAEVTAALEIPTVGIGAGVGCDAQVLVWQDMVGMTPGRLPRFVRRFGEVGEALRQAARDYDTAVRAGEFPAEEHSF